MKYLALLRGVNVGGNAKVPMAALREALGAAGFNNAQTYIQSGNVFVDSTETDESEIAEIIARTVADQFKVHTDVVVFTQKQWEAIIDSAPAWWGQDPKFKHNLLVIIPEKNKGNGTNEPVNMKEVAMAYGNPKPDIEDAVFGNDVIYQRLSWDSFGKTVGGKIASNPLYKQMTIRNYNTSTKLRDLFLS